MASRLRVMVAILSVLVLALVVPSVGVALTQEESLGRFGSRGTGAGEFNFAWALATDSDSGEVFVSDRSNLRIDVFGPWGEFRRAWGWGVATGAAKLETCTSTCGPGIEGSGPGQVAPLGIAVDAEHNVFVFENSTSRVQKFSPNGAFLLMFGGEVNKTTGGNVCTAASGDECGTGVEGSAPGFFSTLSHPAGSTITLDSGDGLLVSDDERIQRFNLNGELTGTISGGVLSGNSPVSISVDQSSGDIYVVLGGRPNVYRLSPSGALLDELIVQDPLDVATDSKGNVFINVPIASNHLGRILQYDSEGEPGESLEVAEDFETGFSVRGLATNSVGDLYVAHQTLKADYITFLGPPPLKYGPPPKVAPEITAQFASAVGTGGADLSARIDPHYWADTAYYVEYGTDSCAPGECESLQPAPPGIQFGKAVNGGQATEAIHLSGLQSGTTYHYRFVSQSGGGGPVYGIDPDGAGPEEASPEDGLEGTFTTFAAEGAVPPCPNDILRTGAGALLPDCRAHEMVSPLDKEGGDILAPINITGFENRLNQSSLEGDKLTYSSYRAFGGSKSASYVSQYIASRGPGGWSSEALAEQRGEGFYDDARATENEFKAFSPDLCHAWVLSESEPLLAPGAVAGFPNLYRRDTCPKAYEALSTTQPPDLAPRDFDPDLQGYAADGSKAIFRVNDKLTADATAGKFQLYEASAGGLSLVCVLPDDTPLPGNCTAGSPSGASSHFPNRSGSVRHAMSEDGSRIYWSTTNGEAGLGKLYLRLDGTTTVDVSGKASGAEARFWAASPDGSKALFSVDDQTAPITVLNRNLYEYDLATETATLIAGKTVGVAGAAEDLSHVYFVSEEAIGGNGTEGEPNLYLREDEADTFIATLSEPDVRVENPVGALPRIPSNAAPEQVFHAAQVTPDGGRLAFISNRPLTGIDNTDAVSLQPDSEVFTYAAETGELECASCSPVGAAPVGRNIQAPGNSGSLWTAASLPLGENQLYTPRALADDGSRLFFTAYTDLLPRDQNGKADVYEWELAGTSASCENDADPDYYEINGGCLFLITSGQSPQDSELVDSSPSGRDVFFSTKEGLVAQDTELLDIYDARIGGGFAPPPPPEPSCLGEACQPPVAAPTFQAPVSQVPRAGNPPRRIRCPKGKHRVVRGGEERCVRNGKGRNGKGGNGKGKKRSSNNGRTYR